MSYKKASEYVASIEKRHNMPLETRSCGNHCPMPFSVTDIPAGKVVPVRNDDGGMAGKGGRGAGQSSKSNYGPGGDSRY